MRMKKIIGFLFIGINIFLISFMSISSIQGGPSVVLETMDGFIAPVISQLNLTDGQIESEWESVYTYQNISEFKDGGYVKFANNETHLFSLFVSSVDLGWISVEFEPDPSVCMKNLNDGWTFYINQETSEVTAKDVKFLGTVIPSDDNKNDLTFESVVIENQVFIEAIRPFNTQDTEGYDIVFENGSINIMQFASKGSHIKKHTFYYLLVRTDPVGGENNNNSNTTDNNNNNNTIIIPEIPQVQDLSQLKFLLIGVAPIGVLGFVVFHLMRRVITNPIKHDYNRVTTATFKPPTLKERWNQTFSPKK